MTIIVFLIDTSASMNQRTYIGARPTLLDIAKGAVESFVKLRQRNPESRFDRYMLFTSEEFPNNIKAGWKENLATFMNELKNIKATGLSTVGPAIKAIFDVLNINRMQSGIDTYGSGRSPFYLEPSVIICISDGGKLSSSQGVQDDIFPFPKSNPIPGADLTSEIFRWDQRLFGLILRLTGTPTPETMGLVPSDNSPIDELCEQTGGRTYAVRTHRMFQQCIESLVQKVQSGVVINFEKIGPDPPPVADGKESTELMEIDKDGSNSMDAPLTTLSLANGTTGGVLGVGSSGAWSTSPLNPSPMLQTPPTNSGINSNGASNGNNSSWHTSRKMIYVPRPNNRTNQACFWPIPESYWPDSSILSLPARSAHPNLKFTCTSQEPMVIDNLPFDKYELEPSPLTQYILSRKQPTICWQVFVPNSSKNSDVGHPFGYLKASTTKPCVNLFVMPYNYPVLLPLLDDLFKIHRLKPNKEWRQQFDNYLRTMPPYYATPLKRALERMGVSNVFPDKFDSSLSFIVMNQLKKLKNQAKVEYEKICGEVEKRVNQNLIQSLPSACGPNPSSVGSGPASQHEGIKVKSRRHHGKNFITSNHLLKEKFSHLREQVVDFKNFTIAGVPDSDIQPQVYRNPFDIDRVQLVDQVARMRANFLQLSLNNLLLDKDQDQLHCKPISQMGNYQDYLKKMNPPLREIESTPVRQHMFGNPFKIDKRMSMMVDEADVDLMGAGASRGNKRPTTLDPQIGGPGRPGSKRRKGPVPAEFTLQHLVRSRPSTPRPIPEEPEISSPMMTPPSPVAPTPPVSNVSSYPVQPSSPLYHVQDTPPSSPGVRPDSPMPPITPGGLPSSASVTTPGYLQAVSPPGSPASSPYPREDIPTQGVPSQHLVNGDIGDHHPCNKATEESESDDDAEGNLVMDEQFEDSSIAPRSPDSIPAPVEDRNGLSTPAAPALIHQRRGSASSNVASSRRSSNTGSIGGEDNNHAIVDSVQTIQYNKNLLQHCYKDVKRPGRDFSRLFSKLQNLRGSTESRVKFLKEVHHEALRFKRRALADLLTQCIEDAQSGRPLLSGSGGTGCRFPPRFNNNSLNSSSTPPPPPPVIINGHAR